MRIIFLFFFCALTALLILISDYLLFLPVDHVGDGFCLCLMDISALTKISLTFTGFLVKNVVFVLLIPLQKSAGGESEAFLACTVRFLFRHCLSPLFFYRGKNHCYDCGALLFRLLFFNSEFLHHIEKPVHDVHRQLGMRFLSAAHSDDDLDFAAFFQKFRRPLGFDFDIIIENFEDDNIIEEIIKTSHSTITYNKNKKIRSFFKRIQLQNKYKKLDKLSELNF